MSVHRLITQHILPAQQVRPGLPYVIEACDLESPEVQKATQRILAKLSRPLTENPKQQKLF